MSRNELIQLEGVVVRVLGGGTMDIECQDRGYLALRYLLPWAGIYYAKFMRYSDEI